MNEIFAMKDTEEFTKYIVTLTARLILELKFNGFKNEWLMTRFWAQTPTSHPFLNLGLVGLGPRAQNLDPMVSKMSGLWPFLGPDPP